jgi:hypothetical protein
LLELLRPEFVLVSFVSVLMMRFFYLYGTDPLAVGVRALCISYASFLAVRRFDVVKLAGWLDRKAGPSLSRSLPVALGVLGRGSEQGGRFRRPPRNR